MIAQLRAMVACDRLRDFNRRKLDGALSERLPDERRYGDATGLPEVEMRPDLTVPLHAIGEARPAGALAWAEHGPDQRKNARRLDQHPGATVRQMLPVQLRQPSFEIIADQCHGQVGGALDDTNAEAVQSDAELGCPLHVDRLNSDTAVLEIVRGGFRRQAEARPVGGHHAGGRTRCGKDITAVDQPFEGFLNDLGRKALLQLASEIPNALAAFRYCGRERTIRFAVKQELSVLRIEAHNVRRHHIDGEVRRELQNIFAVLLPNAGPMSVHHEVRKRTVAQRQTARVRGGRVRTPLLAPGSSRHPKTADRPTGCHHTGG